MERVFGECIGEILPDGSLAFVYCSNADESLRPYSMTKLMALAVALDKLRAGVFHLEDVKHVTADADDRKGSTADLVAGQKVTAFDCLSGMMVASGNDATIMLSYFTHGGPEAMLEDMNARAAAIGMRDTVFRSVDGVGGNVSTARDMVQMFHRLYIDFPEYRSLMGPRGLVLHETVYPKQPNLYLQDFPEILAMKGGGNLRDVWNTMVLAKRASRCIIVCSMNRMLKEGLRRSVHRLMAAGFADAATI